MKNIVFFHIKAEEDISDDSSSEFSVGIIHNFPSLEGRGLRGG
jgi:hypothetical protein